MLETVSVGLYVCMPSHCKSVGREGGGVVNTVKVLVQSTTVYLIVPVFHSLQKL